MTAEAETREALLREGATRLRGRGVENPRLDARILLAAVIGRAPETLLPGDQTCVAAPEIARYRAFLARRERREPVSRILGRRAFFGLDFALTPDVLDPRPDSEAVVELALQGLGPEARVLDMGAGSGCLLLAILAGREDASGLGVDISLGAVAVARRNAAALGLAARACFRESCWFAAVTGGFDLIISNPPYVRAGDVAGLAVDVRAYDPVLALDGGDDGLRSYRRIFAAAGAYLKPAGRLILEIGAGQQGDVMALSQGRQWRSTGSRADLSGHVRALEFTFSAKKGLA